MTTATTIATAADRLYRSALAQIDAGEMREASGTLWKASAEAFDALAKRRGWEVDRHMEYEDVYENAKREIPPERLFHGRSASVLMECNWLEDYELDEYWLRSCARDIREMIDVLQEL